MKGVKGSREFRITSFFIAFIFPHFLGNQTTRVWVLEFTLGSVVLIQTVILVVDSKLIMQFGPKFLNLMIALVIELILQCPKKI